jgi:hypothetical protein
MKRMTINIFLHLISQILFANVDSSTQITSLGGMITNQTHGQSFSKERHYFSLMKFHIRVEKQPAIKLVMNYVHHYITLLKSYRN